VAVRVDGSVFGMNGSPPVGGQASSETPQLVIEGLAKSFGDVQAVSDLSLDVREGEIVALLGPSGCGKTTTLRMIAGFERPTAGEISFSGRPVVSVSRHLFVPPDKRNFGMVFQSYALWPHMTVLQNVAYPLKLRRVPPAERRERVAALLEIMGLAGFIDSPVHLLSGGQQQRTSIARALIYQPELVMFDEPFSNLDAKLRTQMRVELKALQARFHMTGVFVTHDQAEALSLANRIAIMRDGRIQQFDTPTVVYEHPANRFVYDFLGRSATFPGTVSAIRNDGIIVFTVDGDASGRIHAFPADGVRLGLEEPAAISVRDGDVTVRDPGELGPDGLNRIAGRLETLLFTGDRREARIAVGETAVIVEVPRHQHLIEGQPVVLEFAAPETTAWPLASVGT
jgi:ABC-type Fe3+/spermidine/putrescine transport system ATPase subunit